MDTDKLKDLGWGLSSAYIGKKGSWDASRQVFRLSENGETEFSTVLLELARLKFPEGWSEGQIPYWKDKDLENESLENVELMTLQVMENRAPGRKSLLNLGVPAKSKEYRQKYRELHKEKFNQYQREYQRKARLALKEKQVSASRMPSNSNEHMMSEIESDPLAQERQEKLDAFLASLEQEKKNG